MLKIIVLFFSLILNIYAAEFQGVKVPDKINIEEKELVLNGIGMRRGTFLNVKVYVGALYVLKKSKEAKTILSLENPKHISMHFLRDVPKEETRGAWTEGFEVAVPKEDQKLLKKYLNELNGLMPDINKKEVMAINFLDKGVEVFINKKKIATIGNKKFSQALFSIWFIKPRDERLMEELLGKG
jgi:hypothetical protein